MSQPPAPALLTTDDRAGLVLLLQAQDALGTARTPGWQEFWSFYSAIDKLSYGGYALIKDPQLKGWCAQLYPPMIKTSTCYGISAAGMYALYVYAQFTAASFTGPDYEPDNTKICDYWADHGGQFGHVGDAFVANATPWNWFGVAGTGMWRMPTQPTGLYDALGVALQTVNNAMQSAGGATATVELFTGTDPTGHADTPAALVAFEQSRFDPKHWADSGAFLTAVRSATLWQEQRDAVAQLLRPTNLTPERYDLLLHLLIGLLTGDHRSQRLGQDVLTSLAGSMEYPNDILANQLVYLVLLHWADPLGGYAWRTAQLTAELTALSALVRGADPGSVALRDSFTNHLKVLEVDTAYPLQDPYSPGIGFTQRITDTLFALDKARSALAS